MGVIRCAIFLFMSIALCKSYANDDDRNIGYQETSLGYEETELPTGDLTLRHSVIPIEEDAWKTFDTNSMILPEQLQSKWSQNMGYEREAFSPIKSNQFSPLLYQYLIPLRTTIQKIIPQTIESHLLRSGVDLQQPNSNLVLTSNPVDSMLFKQNQYIYYPKSATGINKQPNILNYQLQSMLTKNNPLLLAKQRELSGFYKVNSGSGSTISAHNNALEGGGTHSSLTSSNQLSPEDEAARIYEHYYKLYYNQLHNSKPTLQDNNNADLFNTVKGLVPSQKKLNFDSNSNFEQQEKGTLNNFKVNTPYSSDLLSGAKFIDVNDPQEITKNQQEITNNNANKASYSFEQYSKQNKFYQNQNGLVSDNQNDFLPNYSVYFPKNYAQLNSKPLDAQSQEITLSNALNKTSVDNSKGLVATEYNLFHKLVSKNQNSGLNIQNQDFTNPNQGVNIQNQELNGPQGVNIQNQDFSGTLLQGLNTDNDNLLGAKPGINLQNQEFNQPNKAINIQNQVHNNVKNQGYNIQNQGNSFYNHEVTYQNNLKQVGNLDQDKQTQSNVETEEKTIKSAKPNEMPIFGDNLIGFTTNENNQAYIKKINDEMNLWADQKIKGTEQNTLPGELPAMNIYVKENDYVAQNPLTPGQTLNVDYLDFKNTKLNQNPYLFDQGQKPNFNAPETDAPVAENQPFNGLPNNLEFSKDLYLNQLLHSFSQSAKNSPSNDFYTKPYNQDPSPINVIPVDGGKLYPIDLISGNEANTGSLLSESNRITQGISAEQVANYLKNIFSSDGTTIDQKSLQTLQKAVQIPKLTCTVLCQKLGLS